MPIRSSRALAPLIHIRRMRAPALAYREREIRSNALKRPTRKRRRVRRAQQWR